jgi:hypothetical protein
MVRAAADRAARCWRRQANINSLLPLLLLGMLLMLLLLLVLPPLLLALPLLLLPAVAPLSGAGPGDVKPLGGTAAACASAALCGGCSGKGTT